MRWPRWHRSEGVRSKSHTLLTQSGQAEGHDGRAVQSSEKAAMIYQHSDDERQQEVAGGIDAKVRAARQKASPKPKPAREA